mgnify:CR=1 FL=1
MPPGADLAAVLALAACGLLVVPLWPAVPGQGCSCRRGPACTAPGKHPAAHHVPRGLLDASGDPEMLRRWWSRPERRTGRPWSIGAAVPAWAVVLDLDGPEAAEALRAEGLALPATLTALTGRGEGFLHLWYRTERPISPAVGVLPHVDVRGPGSYVVAPPSVHVTGRRYRWRGASAEVPDWQELAEAPGWLYTVARPAPEALGTDPERWGELLSGPVPEGQRNATAAKLAGLLFRRLPAGACWPLLESWNATACRPPLDGDELARVAASIAARELARRGGQ